MTLAPMYAVTPEGVKALECYRMILDEGLITADEYRRVVMTARIDFLPGYAGRICDVCQGTAQWRYLDTLWESFHSVWGYLCPEHAAHEAAVRDVKNEPWILEPLGTAVYAPIIGSVHAELLRALA